ncbi:MAG TPA: prenyltransferase/squalene oxidase repeat-containing protein [Gemmataceae bacterium]|nr:prenyltransferase/squalene oxidase repeat-containing protein [Gemmataceae bacterium]
MKPFPFAAGVACAAWMVFAAPRLGAEELEPKVKDAVNKGLEWLAKNQNRDGHWEAAGGQYAPAMTGMAGMALLMEGSTTRDGKYANNIRKARDYFIAHCQPNGLLCRPGTIEAGRYMHGQGYALLFLASVYGEEEESDSRRKLEDVLTRAVQFCSKAQTSAGGWGYVSAMDGGDFAEGSVTVTQMQALRAARNAGIVVPKEVIDKATKYLVEKCTFQDGQVGYLPGRRAITPGLTTAGVACMFSAGQYHDPAVKKWLGYIAKNVAPLSGGAGRQGHDEYTHYYYAQCLYILGDDGYARLFPDSKPNERLTWSAYRKQTFDTLVRAQASDGSWSGGSNWSHVGPVYVTACYLTILQLDKATLPIYQR